MEEKRYKIEKVERDISAQKKAQVTHTANCAAYAILTVYISTLSVLSQNPVSNVIGLSLGGAVATLSVLEMININKRKKLLNDLIDIKNRLMENEEEEIKDRSK